MKTEQGGLQLKPQSRQPSATATKKFVKKTANTFLKSHKNDLRKFCNVDRRVIPLCSFSGYTIIFAL